MSDTDILSLEAKLIGVKDIHRSQRTDYLEQWLIEKDVPFVTKDGGKHILLLVNLVPEVSALYDYISIWPTVCKMQLVVEETNTIVSGFENILAVLHTLYD